MQSFRRMMFLLVSLLAAGCSSNSVISGSGAVPTQDEHLTNTESVCQSCAPTPQPSIKPTPKPTPKPSALPRQPLGDPGQGYNFHAIFRYTPTTAYLDDFVEVLTTGYTLTADPNDSMSFSNNETWRLDGSDDDAWQEIGYTVGELNGSYYQGIFGAFQTSDGTYEEFAIDYAPPATTQLCLCVITGLPSSVNINYDNQTYATVANTEGNSDNMDLGLESNSGTSNSFNSFSGNPEALLPQVNYPTNNGAWTYWPTSRGGPLSAYSDALPTNSVSGDVYANGSGQPYVEFYYY